MEKLFEEFDPKTLKEWNEKIISDLKGKNYENLIWESPENIKIAPVYNLESIKELRGNTTHNHSNWEIEQVLNNPKNKKVLACLNGGASALLLKNVPAKNLKTVLKDVLIQHIQTSLQSDAIDSNLDAFITLIEKRKLDKNSIKGSLQYDPLMESLKKGNFNADLWNEFRSVHEKTNSLSAYKSISIQGQEYHNAGASTTQELAFTLTQISEYFANNKDLQADKIQVSLGISTNYFFEIAKLRSIRVLWSQILKAYKKEETTLDLRAETGLRTGTIFDPYVNILRTTSQCMSAAIGGANTINVNSFNASYKEEDDFAQRIARNTSLILKEESYFNKVSDPSAGSYYIEHLTNELSQNAWNLFQKIEAQGGWIEAVKTNFIQEIIEQNAALQEEDLNDGKTQLLGTNLYPNTEEEMSSKMERSAQNDFVKGKDFKALNTKRLSARMDVERLTKEENHA